MDLSPGRSLDRCQLTAQERALRLFVLSPSQTVPNRRKKEAFGPGIHRRNRYISFILNALRVSRVLSRFYIKIAPFSSLTRLPGGIYP